VSWWSSDDPRRRAAFVAAVLAGAAVLGLSTGSVLSMVGDNATVDATSPTASPTPTPTSPSPSATTRPRASSEIEPGTTSDIGYFIGSQDKKDGTHVTFDRVLLLLGQQARDYAKAHHEKKPKKDGVLLVNDNPLTRDLVLDPNVKVMGAQLLAGTTSQQSVPLQTLLDKVASDGSHLLLDLTYDKLGYVVTVKEHDLP
jgi:hypothetical protein